MLKMYVHKKTRTAAKLKLKMRKFTRTFDHFARDEDGAMTIFAIMMFLMMLMVAGMGVDVMHNEMQRTKMQNTIDRAVLAAADLDQTLDPVEVVNDYFDKAGIDGYLLEVTVDQGLNFRTVKATASATTPTQFMSYFGVNELITPAASGAEERISNVEISLVLDISGSMGNNSRIHNMRNAAKTFVDLVIKDETEDLISVSLVPYTAQSIAGKDIFNELNITKRHGYSYCVDFEISDFNTTVIDPNKQYKQMQHFERGWSSYWSSQSISNPTCPKRSYEEVKPISQNKAALKSTIGSYSVRSNTAINLGMKWGVTLLDPSFQPITQKLKNKGKIEGVFVNRPASYHDEETLKTIVLMTDGVNVDTVRIADKRYNSNSERVHWNRNALDRYLYYNVPSWKRHKWMYTKYTASQANSMLSNICSAAKGKGIVIWSVGFAVTDASANIMRSCASSPSHFFRVEGVEITEAFQAIASQINQLRLVQ
jgi:Flp pilus assembly protein TadG